MRNRIRNGFTIVEMLMVVAVLAVLMGIVGTAASSAIRQARSRKAVALQQCVQVGIATYHAQKGHWPGKLKNLAENGGGDESVHELSVDDYDGVMLELAKVSVQGKNAPVMDVSGLIVARKGLAGKDYRNPPKASGQEFREAVKQGKKRGAPVALNDMAFGYQESSHGYFRRFHITYNADSDSVTVSQ